MGTIALPFLLIEQNPIIQGQVGNSPAQIDRAKALLKRNDPRRLAAGEVVTQWIDEEEITLIAGYALSQLKGGGVNVELHPGRAYTQLTLGLPDNPIGPYMNISIYFSQWSSTLAIESLSIGSITVPGWIAEPLRDYGNLALMRIPEYKAAMHALNGLQLLEDRMLVIYQWQPDLVDKLKSQGRDLIVDEALKIRLLAYSKQIRLVAANPGLPRETSLTEFLKPLFVLADARGGDPVEENRAALLALSFFFSGVDIARMMGVQLPDGKQVNKRLTLSNRYDFAQHFLTSAALTLTAGQGFADTVGLFKELDDAKGGSGFSFTDLGADRTGVRLAELAVANAASARKVQAFMIKDLKEEQFIPHFLDLPELLTEEEFERVYGGVGGKRYNELVADIESRLDTCSLYL
ncbi:MAG: hypothetical protein ACJAVI_002451 [Candidatus Azotimanducaceae bacterium]